MALNLKKFVDINIIPHTTTTINSTRDTAVVIWDGTTDVDFADALYTSSGTTTVVYTCGANWLIYTSDNVKVESPTDTLKQALGSALHNNESTGIICENGYLKINFSSSDVDYYGLLSYENFVSTGPKNFANVFFANGGAKLLYVKKGTDYATTISGLDNKYIVVSATGTLAITDLPTLTGINQKILVSNFTGSTLPTTYKTNFVWKYGSKGIEATVLAYLTRVNVNSANSVKDYAFTEESFISTTSDVAGDDMINSIVDTPKYNAIGYLAGGYRNIGGNDSNGNDLINQFMLIVLHQTLTERLTQVLVSKIKYDQSGLNLVSATISDELAVYANNGYLTRNKMWTEDDYTISVGGNTYTLISKNSTLPLGYKYLILPFSTLTAAQKQAHAFPAIYVILATSYGIRFISVDGESF